jgi:hypothetical protein
MSTDLRSTIMSIDWSTTKGSAMLTELSSEKPRLRSGGAREETSVDRIVEPGVGGLGGRLGFAEQLEKSRFLTG